MITFIILFWIADSAMGTFFDIVFSHAENIHVLLAVMIFLSLVMLVGSETRRYSWVGFLIAIIFYALFNMIAPHYKAVAFFLSLAITITATIVIKHFLWKATGRKSSNRQPIPNWARLLILFIWSVKKAQPHTALCRSGVLFYY